MKPGKARLILVSGPAGSGKTTLCDRLLESFPDVERVITATTRQPRPNEEHGRDYFFLDEKTFEKKINNDEFYEHAWVHGKHYGVLKQEIDSRLEQGVDLLLNIDIQGAESFRKAASINQELANRMLTVFILPQSIEQLSERLVHRASDDSDEIERRLAVAQKEMLEADKFDHTIISGTRDDDFGALKNIYKESKRLQ